MRFRDGLQKEGFWSAIGRIPPDCEAQETMRSIWERDGKWSLEKQVRCWLTCMEVRACWAAKEQSGCEGQVHSRNIHDHQMFNSFQEQEDQKAGIY